MMKESLSVGSITTLEPPSRDIAAGSTNKEIIGATSTHGARAVGLCGGDTGLIRADHRRHVLPDGREIGLGRVGDVKAVDPGPLELL